MDNEPNLKKEIDTKFGWAPHGVIYDPQLSLKAKGLWLYIHTKPQGWHFAAERIARETSDGEKSIKAGLRELVEKGYLSAKRQSSGRILYILSEKGKSQQGSNREEKPVENPKGQNGIVASEPKAGFGPEPKRHEDEMARIINKEENKKRDKIKKEWGGKNPRPVENSVGGLAGELPAADNRPLRKNFDSQEDFIKAMYNWNTAPSAIPNYQT